MRQLHEEGELTGAAAQWMAPERPEFELYDLDADPYEVRNLARVEGHVPTLSRLRGALDDWIEESNDHGRELEDPLPAEYALRTMVDGWYTNSGRLSKSAGVLRFDWKGHGRRQPEAVVPWVTPGGGLRVRLEMRSEQAQELVVRWGTPAQMGGAGSAAIDLEGGNGWSRLETDISCDGWLAWFSVRFRQGAGPSECREAVLERTDPAGIVRTWSFA